MSPTRLIGLALQSIRRHAARSALTMLGVIIGVASVIVMVAIGQGAQAEIQARIDGLGTNLIVVSPASSQRGGVSGGAGSFNRLTTDDAKLLQKEAQHLREVSPVIMSRTMIAGTSGNWRTALMGVDPSYEQIRAWPVADGRWFTAEELQGNRKVCLLGATVARSVFAEDDPVGRTVRIRSVPMEIVGVLRAKGQNADGADQDDLVLVPWTTMQTRLAGWQHVGQIVASARSKGHVGAAMEEVRGLLRESHRLSPAEPDDFELKDQAALAEAAKGATEVMTTLLLAIASVSLVVGGIGIMNIMLVSVSERTREIGIRRAIGARRSDVLAQFLVESVVLSGLGGLLGVGLGLVVTEVVARLTGWTTVVSPGSVALALGFSAAVGVFFGLYPARRAASLDVIEALRSM